MLFRQHSYHEFSRIFFCGKLYHFGGINDLDLTNLQNSRPAKKISKGASDLFILMDSCNYLYSFQTKAAASFFININCCFPDQGKVGHHTSTFTETKIILCSFLLPQKHLLLVNCLISSKPS